MFQISVQNDVLALPSGELVLIGRGENCDIQLDDPSASRVHCRLLSRKGKVFLTDAGSRWGTFVNGTRVEECELKPGDQITVGETVLLLAAEGTPHGTTLARRSEVHRPSIFAKEAITPPEISANPAVVATEIQPHSAASSASARAAARSTRMLRESDYLGGKFAGYHVCERLRITRSGIVFLATGAEGTVALKLFHPAAIQDEKTEQRFLRGVATVKGLHHPHLVALYQGGLYDDIFYTASEYIAGESAAEMIQRIGIAGMLDWRTTLKRALDIARALDFTEKQNLVHRNITPRHILVDRTTGTAKLNGLLLAKTLSGSGNELTGQGDIVGELAYLSPEQVGDEAHCDHRSDLYQLGATLYALLTGRPPCSGPNVAATIQEILVTPPPKPTQFHLSIPALLEGTVLTLLAKRPEDRCVSASALIAALERVRNYLPAS